jgi:hypothetical protein
MNAKKIITAVIIAGVIIFFFSFVGCERIDAGNVGIKVNNAGGRKRYFKNGICYRMGFLQSFFKQDI